MAPVRLVKINSLHRHPRADIIPPMRPSEWQAFYTDVAMRGIRVPIEVLGDGTIVDGHHRYRAAQDLGLARVPIVDAPLNGDDSFTYLVKAALMRRHLTDGQRAALAVYWMQENKLTPQSQPRTKKGDYQPSERRGSDGDTNPTRREAKATFSVSQRAVATASKIFHSDPDLLALVHRGETTLKGAAHQVKQREDKARIVNTKPPKGQYQVLVIDPPWPYSNRDQDPSHQGKSPYVALSLEQIGKLPIPAAPESILWLWTTNAFLPDAFGLLAGWGFEYKTMLTWAKDKFGLGDWLRGQTEHCLLAVRGGYRVTPGSASTLLLAKAGAHSEKPVEFYALVEKLCPGNKLDMFARQRRDGWDSWGAGLPPT